MWCATCRAIFQLLEYNRHSLTAYSLHVQAPHVQSICTRKQHVHTHTSYIHTHGAYERLSAAGDSKEQQTVYHMFPLICTRQSRNDITTTTRQFQDTHTAGVQLNKVLLIHEGEVTTEVEQISETSVMSIMGRQSTGMHRLNHK